MDRMVVVLCKLVVRMGLRMVLAQMNDWRVQVVVVCMLEQEVEELVEEQVVEV